MKQYLYFSLNHYKTDKVYVAPDKPAIRFSFVMDPDTVLYKRIVYTFWEFFGEIGGFLEILTIFGGFIVSIGNIISGSDLEGYLISQLFYSTKEN